MEAIIFNGSNQGDKILESAYSILEEELRNKKWKVTSFILREVKIAPCRGCFDCWLKTPGVCITNDMGRVVTNSAVKCDLWIFITPIFFGGYSSELKKAVDRLLPIFVPVFTKVDGETHHRLRYGKHPLLLGIGHRIGGISDNDNIFKNLVSRNAINFRSPNETAEILLPEFTIEQIRDRVTRGLSTLGIM